MARGEYDPARHGTEDAQLLTAAEHLELLATAQYLARSYKPSFEIDNALQAGTTWAQVAAALGTDAPSARAAYRQWADGQHDLLSRTQGRVGMSNARYAVALARLDEPDPGTAKAYAAEHPLLCAHADQNGAGSHWLEPGEKCPGAWPPEVVSDREAGQ
jgi:hypothetical protein